MGTGSPRPYTWAKTWARLGHDVTVVSRHWSGNEKNWDDYIQDTSIQTPLEIEKEGFRLISLPFKKYAYPKNGFVRKADALISLSKGTLEREVDTMQYMPFLETLFKKEKFDFFIATNPPWNITRLAYEIHKKFETPFALDYRDYENDVILPLKPKLSNFRKIEFQINKTYMKSWGSYASLIVGASEPINNYVSNMTNVSGIEITNGYDEDIFSNLKDHPPFEKFTISVLGYLYPPQDLTILFNGVNQFIEEIGNPNFHFYFVGVNAIKEVADKIRNNIPSKYITITDRMPQVEALEIGQRSHALFYAGWTNWRGVYSAKIFEYLAMKKNILIAPGDNYSIDDLMKKSNAGIIANTSEEFSKALKSWYRQWEQNGTINYEGNFKIAEKYSRQNQAKILINRIEKIVQLESV